MIFRPNGENEQKIRQEKRSIWNKKIYVADGSTAGTRLSGKGRDIIIAEINKTFKQINKKSTRNMTTGKKPGKNNRQGSNFEPDNPDDVSRSRRDPLA